MRTLEEASDAHVADRVPETVSPIDRAAEEVREGIQMRAALCGMEEWLEWRDSSK
jgi:hypothetical protein